MIFTTGTLSTSTQNSTDNNPDNYEKFGVITYIFINITKHRWRTFLTVMGIAVPIMFFILFAAMGEGLEQYIIYETSEFEENYLGMLDIINAWTNVLLFIIAIMIIISITNTILMSTAERKYEFGVLKATGISQGQILYLVLLEALIISILALIVGILLGFWGAIFFDYMFKLDQGAGFIFAPAQISQQSIILVTILTLFIGTITAIYPAYRASKFDIIEVLRYE